MWTRSLSGCLADSCQPSDNSNAVAQARTDRVPRRAPVLRLAGWQSESRDLLFWNLFQPVDDRRNVSRAEAVVNVYYADIRGAGVQHPQQRGDTLVRSAVTDAGRHGDDRHAHQAADDAGQRAFHPCADDDDAG